MLKDLDRIQTCSGFNA